MSILEEPRATWEKRFEAKHYSYRDFHRPATVVMSGVPNALLDPTGEVDAFSRFTALNTTVYYIFGNNARGNSPANWPRLGDHEYARTAYAREVLVMCDEDCWIRFVCMNPEYVRQAVLAAATGVAPSASMLIYEEPMFIEAGVYMRFFLTYGYAVVYWAAPSGVAGTLSIWCEGNAEGGE